MLQKNNQAKQLKSSTIEYKTFRSLEDFTSGIDYRNVASFLEKHLDQYGDPLEDIINAIEYIWKQDGGVVLVALDNTRIAGAVVINETGMSGYIPENILVYIAVDQKYRGKGIGKELMKLSIKTTKGDIALHVEKNNPARFLYEKIGFKNPYLEMRYKRNRKITV